VGWRARRSESLMSDNQGRDGVSEAALALDADGRFLGLHVRRSVNLGAYHSSHGAHIATRNFARCFPTVYAIPAVDVAVCCVFTNTVPTGPYRGAGRPEANYVMERLVEEAARVTGIDSCALRRRNFIAPTAMPYATPVGTHYDSGDFPAVFERALEAGDVAGFAARRAESQEAGLHRGLGVSCFLEHAGGLPKEDAALTFPGDGRLRIALAVQASGQNHVRVFRRLAAECLGLDESRIEIAEGDSADGLTGGPSVASRSAMAVGPAITRAVESVIGKARPIAARMLAAEAASLVYQEGAFSASGGNRHVSLIEAAAEAERLRQAGDPVELLDTYATFRAETTFPNGCHIAEIEVDPETGAVRLDRYTAIDDCGRVLDPVTVEGQIMGGIAQGVGQALWEQCRYDDESGQLITGSLMDYALPRADQMPWFQAKTLEIASLTNPLGVKGVGEAGTTGALAAVMNAVIDAVPEARHLQMPATSEALWRACRAGAAPSPLRSLSMSFPMWKAGRRGLQRGQAWACMS